MPREIVSPTAATTHRVGELLAVLVEAGDVVSLSGDLGAGKTCLVKGVAAGLGVTENVTSPTFNILLEHHGRLDLFHFDLYRLERAGQLEDIDFYGATEAGGVSFIEWGERFPEALPEDHLSVDILIDDDDSRRFVLNPSGPRASALASAWSRACDADGAV
jgi:tRNA threonylcarbamoyladenosine biosynthesis protein TsaE